MSNTRDPAIQRATLILQLAQSMVIADRELPEFDRWNAGRTLAHAILHITLGPPQHWGPRNLVRPYLVRR